MKLEGQVDVWRYDIGLEHAASVARQLVGLNDWSTSSSNNTCETTNSVSHTTH